MKKILLASMLLACTSIFAQDVKPAEPDFVGEAYILKADGTTEPLDKSKFNITMKPGLKIKQYLEVPGCCSRTKVQASAEPLKVVIKMKDNSVDPTALINIFKFEVKKDRTTEVSSTALMGKSDQGGKIKYAEFSGKKYGQSSYLLTIVASEPGEYGILIKEMGNQNISCFGVN
jgi:hypothetical protein